MKSLLSFSLLQAIWLLVVLLCPSALLAEISNPILFVTQVPKPEDFANIVSTFGNHRATLDSAPRGGDLWIRYPDGSLKNLTNSAGYGKSGFQGDSGIAVRDPAVHWSGSKALFSMVVGSPAQYEYEDYRFQLYEISGLGKTDTPVITKVAHQPEDYNNVMPVYGTDDSIFFISDRPYNGQSHLYPQLDEYESTPTNTGLWKLTPQSGVLKIIDHSPSGDFDPIVDSFGRVLFVRWDHLQRDQQNDAGVYGAYNMSSESTSASPLATAAEVFPEPRSNSTGAFGAVQGHRFNLFMPWMCEEDGTELETLNHVGRHELHDYFTNSFLSDGALKEFLGQSSSRLNQYSIQNFFHISEDPNRPGVYLGVNAPEFYTHTSGQIIELYGPEGTPADEMYVEPITHPSTSSPDSSPPPSHSGLYRNPVMLTTGELLAAHTSETQADNNTGSRAFPSSRYDYRLRVVAPAGQYSQASTFLTNGISKSVQFYDPDVLVTYSGPLWELQPVEVVARAIPYRLNPTLSTTESSIFDTFDVSLEEFKEYLVQTQSALIVSRDVTTRDESDTQQPFNLRVAQSGAQTVGSAGDLYDISSIAFLQGNLVRRYTNLHQGVRTLAQRIGSTLGPLSAQSGGVGSVPIASDGSIAVLLPAGKATTWELLSPAGESVVKERYWVTFQPGEVRVCTSCHGINSFDQAGNIKPQNAPLALAQLLAWWKDGGADQLGEVSINAVTRVSGKKNRRRNGVRSRGKLRVRLIGQNGISGNTPLTVRFTVDGFQCDESVGPFSLGEDRKSVLRRRAPRVRGKHPLTIKAYASGFQVGLLHTTLRGPGKRKKGLKLKKKTKICRVLSKLSYGQ